MKSTRWWKKFVLVFCPMTFVFTGSNCVPDNLLADTAGQIVNGLIITTFNAAISGSGITI